LRTKLYLNVIPDKVKSYFKLFIGLNAFRKYDIEEIKRMYNQKVEYIKKRFCITYFAINYYKDHYFLLKMFVREW